MKKFLVLAVALTVFAASSFAASNAFLMGGRVETGKSLGDYKFFVTFGTAIKLGDVSPGVSLYTFNYVDAGKYGSVANEVGMSVNIPQVSGLGVGLIAGPNVDWIANVPTAGIDPTVYLTTAAGGFLWYDIKPTFGVWGYAKYKFSLETGNLYPEGTVAGAGLLVRF